MAEAMLHLEGLRKKFGALVVTDDLTFDVRPNELHAVIGDDEGTKFLPQPFEAQHGFSHGRTSATTQP